MKIKSKQFKKNDQISTYYKIILGLFFILATTIKFESFEYISPKLGIPNAYSGNYNDFFNLFKFEAGIFLSVIILILFSIYIYYNEKKYNLNDLILLFLSIFIIISIYFSEYKYLTLWGTFERYATALFFLNILFLFFVATKTSFNEIDLKILDLLLIIFLLVNFILSFIYFLGVNLLDYELFKRLIFVPYEISPYVNGFIMGTLENPNYYSGFAAFLFMYFLVKFYFEKDRNYLFLIAMFLSFSLVLFSKSISGLVSISFVLPIFLLYLFLYGRKEKNNLLNKTFLSLISLFFSFFLLTILDDNIRLEVNSFINILFKFKNFYLFANIFVLISLYALNKKNLINVVYKKRFYILIITALLIFCSIFMYSGSSEYGEHYPRKIYSQQKILSTLEEASIADETFSGRIHIWMYTLDLVKDKPFFGYGMNTLLYEYPQTSVLKIENLKDVIISKPHNHYLEILYGAGIFSLALFVLLFFNIIIKFLYSNAVKFDKLNFSLFLAMIVFLIQGVVNDMEVGSYPIVFIMFGVLCSRLDLFFENINISREMETTNGD